MRLEQNEIYGIEPDYYTNFRKNGLLFINSYGELCDNTFSDIGYAMQFSGNCTGLNGLQVIPTKLITNEINECRYGMVLKNTDAKIGDQGSSDKTHGNTFDGPFNNPGLGVNQAFRTYCFGANGGLSPFWVEEPLTDEPLYNGTDGTNAIQTLDAVTSAQPWECDGGSNKTAASPEKDSIHQTQNEGSEFTVSIFPNPANYTIEIIVSETDETLYLEWYNMMGQIVGSSNIKTRTTWDVSSFNEGLYVLKFTSTTGVQHNSRLVIIR